MELTLIILLAAMAVMGVIIGRLFNSALEQVAEIADELKKQHEAEIEELKKNIEAETEKLKKDIEGGNKFNIASIVLSVIGLLTTIIVAICSS